MGHLSLINRADKSCRSYTVGGVKSGPAQRLRVLPTDFTINHVPGQARLADDLWFSVVRAPEGLTVIREDTGGHSADDAWTGLYGDNGHSLDLPGMLAAVIGPLAAAAIPVFVTSTYHSDVVLVPRARRDEAVSVLRAAGHEVVVGLSESGPGRSGAEPAGS
jgi:uncharacterized protein